MYIEKIHIDSFGKLSDFLVELEPGVNIIEGANESGKSTLAAFIKFVFYGIPPRERKTAASWQTGGLSGSVTVNDGEKSLRLERSFVGNRELVQLVDCETNMPIRGLIEDTTPGELFFGVSAEMFEATAFVSQLGGTVSGGAKVSEGIENILFSADESINTQKALSRLDTARAAILHKNEKGGKLFELDGECAEMEVRLSDALNAHDDILAKEAQLADLKEKYEAAAKKAGEIGAKVEQFEARSLLELFSRARKLNAKCSELREKIEQSSDVDIDAVRALEADIAKLAALKEEADEAEKTEMTTPVPDADDELDEYIENGGRLELEAQKNGAISKGRSYTIVGVITLLLGLVLAAVSGLAFLLNREPNLIMIIASVLMLALSVTTFVLGARARADAKLIEDKYDFDELEARIRVRASALEAAKMASLGVLNARRRLDAARDDIAKRYACEEHELADKLLAQKQKLRSADTLRVEYDKYASVLSQIKLQLKPYDEAELKAKIDDSVDISELNADNIAELRREAAFSTKMADSLERHIVDVEKTLAGLYPGAEDPSVLSDRLSVLKSERERLRKLHAAYVLASEKIMAASEGLRSSIAPRLASDTAELMAHITDGKYKSLGVGAGLELCVETEHGTKSIDVLSCGTKDAAYLSLRMALVSLLYRKELPPMLYDEAFVRQDNKRLGAMLKLARISGLQSIVLTSNHREAEEMAKIGAYNHVKI